MNTRMRKISLVVAGVAAMISLSACSMQGESKAQVEGQKQTEQAFEQQSTAVPYPAEELKDSLERRNLVEKLRRENKPDKIGYVYIMNYGKFMGYYTVKGKISSNQSQMTATELQAKMCDSCERMVVTAPGDDGSYGENEQGIFFFTTNGVMVKTSMDYMYSDAPLAIDVPDLSPKTGPSN